MHLIFLGTASCYPTAQRGVSCTALRLDDGSVWIFDCGEGSQVQVQKSTIHPGKIKKIFITHLHGDHLFGLPGLMCTLGSQVQNDKNDFILEIYGPFGLRRYVRENLNLSRSPLPFKYKVHELIPFDKPDEIKNWDVCEEASDPLHPQEILGETIHGHEGVYKIFSDKVTVLAAPLVHRIPCFGFVIEESPLPGTLNAAKLLEEGVQPGPLFKSIKLGQPITLPNGKIIKPEDVVGPVKPGRKITILGDTRDSSAIAKLALNCDILMHEATLEDGMESKAIENGHSTPSMAVDFAQSIAAKKLILFHFSQRYKPSGDESKDDLTLSTLYNEAKSACLKKNFDCDIMLADDLMEIEIKRGSE